MQVNSKGAHQVRPPLGPYSDARGLIVTRFQVPEGSLDPALHWLENRGLLTADWASDKGRESKFIASRQKGESN
jgi:DNA-binding PadR family transcriptional regulator